MCKNIVVEPDRPQMTIWRMRIACWIPKATDTHSEYIIHKLDVHEFVHRDTIREVTNKMQIG